MAVLLLGGTYLCTESWILVAVLGDSSAGQLT